MEEIAVKLIAMAVQAAVAIKGVKGAGKILDLVRTKMVEENRAPTDEEMESLMQGIEDRSDRIQGA